MLACCGYAFLWLSIRVGHAMPLLSVLMFSASEEYIKMTAEQCYNLLSSHFCIVKIIFGLFIQGQPPLFRHRQTARVHRGKKQRLAQSTDTVG